MYPCLFPPEADGGGRTRSLPGKVNRNGGIYSLRQGGVNQRLHASCTPILLSFAEPEIDKPMFDGMRLVSWMYVVRHCSPLLVLDFFSVFFFGVNFPRAV